MLIYGTERERYAAVREELQNLSIQMPPEQSANISKYLRHSVPPETMRYTQERYQQVINLINKKEEPYPRIEHDSIVTFIYY